MTLLLGSAALALVASFCGLVWIALELTAAAPDTLRDRDRVAARLIVVALIGSAWIFVALVLGHAIAWQRP